MDAAAYRADIDGLRGVAVSAVVLYHCHLGLSGGYVGVDVFFVISGFLITRLILAAQQKDAFSLREFWMRRVRRLAPAVIVMVVSTMAVGGWLMFPRDYYYFSKSSLAQVLLASNIHFYHYLDYFAGPAEQHPLLHTWSLAVEEQFYLGFPLLMVLGRRWAPRRVPWLLAFICVASLAYSVYCVRSFPSAAFFLLPSRAWELTLGALLVFIPLTPWRGPRADAWWEGASLVGLAAIAAPFWTYSQMTTFPGAAALPPCLGTALVIYANTHRTTVVSRLLSTPWLVGIGLISYSLYLWHWPILSFLHYWHGESLSPTVTAAALAASVACGYVSWRLIESPFRRRRVAPQDAVLLRAAIACSLFIAAVSGASLATRGLPVRWGNTIAQVLERSGNTMQQYRTGQAGAVQRGQLPRIGDGPTAPRVLIWGDSHAAAIGAVCDGLARKHRVAGYVASRGGTVPLLGAYRPEARDKVLAWNESVVKFVRDKRIRHVILVSRWAANIAIRDNGLSDALIVDGETAALDPDEAKRAMRRSLRRTVDQLTQAGAKVWIMRQVPHQDRNPLRLIIDADEGQQHVSGVTLAEHFARQEDVAEIFSNVKNAAFLDPAEHCFDERGLSKVGTADVSYYSDPSHLSTAGGRQLIKPLLEPVFAAIAAEQTAVARR